MAVFCILGSLEARVMLQSEDKVKSKKHVVIIHRTTKDMLIKSGTIGLVRAVAFQLADVVRATIKDVLESFG